jgi:hypothetical protein
MSISGEMEKALLQVYGQFILVIAEWIKDGRWYWT